MIIRCNVQLVRSKLWPYITVNSAAVSLNLLVDSAAPLSSLSSAVVPALVATGCLRPIKPRLYAADGLAVQGQSLPTIHFRVGGRADELHIDGILGLTFLGRFDLHFSRSAMVLTLYE